MTLTWSLTGDPSRGLCGRLSPRRCPLSRALVSILALTPILTVSPILTTPLRSQGATAAGDAKEAAAKEAKAKKARPPLFFLRDGGKVAGASQATHLTVSTSYGTLQVPVTEIIQIRFARRVDPSKLQKIDELIALMGSDDFDEREEAMEGLRNIGPDASARLRKAKESENEEVRNRAEILIDEIGEKTEEDKSVESEVTALSGDKDEVVTQRFTFKGKIEADSFQIESRYGVLELSAADLLAVNFQAGLHVERSLKVQGANQPPSNWMKTKVRVEKGTPLEIVASGSCTISNYGMTADPAGTTRYSTTRNFNRFPSLALVGQIGKKGKPFLVGTRFKGKANASGELYLGVVPYRTYVGAGTYKVKVEAGD